MISLSRASVVKRTSGRPAEADPAVEADELEMASDLVADSGRGCA